MADSLEDLGGYSIFPVEPNWLHKPSMNLELARILMKYTGTAAKLSSFTDHVPEAWKLGFTPSKEDEHDLIVFFIARYGKHGGFWIKIPAREFTLYSNSLSGSTEIRVENNGAEQQYQGYERIWIDMHSNDILTRKVLTTTKEDDYLSLGLSVSLDRDVTPSTHFKICRLLFCRFDEDMLKMSFGQNQYPDITLAVRELVREYPA